MFYPHKCIGCGKCFEVCEKGCHIAESEHKIDRKLCEVCGKCAAECNAGALTVAGRYYTVPEVLKTVAADLPFYKNSNGGMTCSGGEPLLQYEFAEKLLTDAKELGIHTAVDTAGDINYGVFERVMDKVGLFLFDLKCMDEKKHLNATGTENRRILENLKRLGNGPAPVWVRIPVVPGVNDNLENMEETAEFIKPLAAVETVELLPYHNLGISKYASLGMNEKISEKTKNLKAPDEETIKKLAGVFAGNHYKVKP
jgi:pyruvate formate lyase activating enzyme